MNHKETGELGENLAVRYLRKKGYLIKERNYRVRSGEVDIIALHNKVLVFIEVKTRTSTQYGSPEEAVTHRKQRQISKAALSYIDQFNLHKTDARFDVVSVLVAPDSEPHIELITDAFELNYD